MLEWESFPNQAWGTELVGRAAVVLIMTGQAVVGVMKDPEERREMVLVAEEVVRIAKGPVEMNRRVVREAVEVEVSEKQPGVESEPDNTA